MPFRKHVFISYAHVDNKPANEGDTGWVSQFHWALDAFLSRKYGRPAEIWRDERLQSNDVFAKEIFSQFPDTAVLLSVITPRYLDSKWCRDEAFKFCEVAQQPPGLVIDNKSRVFKIILEPVDSQDSLPAPMRDTLGKEFYVREKGKVHELDPAFGAEMKAKLNLAVADLAAEIADLLRRMEIPGAAAASSTPTADAVTGPAVYLAECNYDRREDRNALKTELRMKNYRVLPDRELPRDEAEFRAEVARLLEQCVLSIHLVGSVYGRVPDGPSQSSEVVIQNELAVERARSAGLRRVISLPAGTHSDDPKQQAFIKLLDRDPEAQLKAEVITADLESVKTAVHAALAPPPAPAATRDEPQGVAKIYVIFDARDLKDEVLLQLRKCLLNRGLTVRKPAFGGGAEEVRKTHEGHLAECDAVLIYYGSGTDSWKQSIDRDVEKAKGRPGGRKLRAEFTWIAEPASADKDDVLAEGTTVNLIDGRGGFSEALVDEKIVKLVLGGRS